jgi:hypothetical protein
MTLPPVARSVRFAFVAAPPLLYWLAAPAAPQLLPACTASWFPIAVLAATPVHMAAAWERDRPGPAAQGG